MVADAVSARLHVATAVLLMELPKITPAVPLKRAAPRMDFDGVGFMVLLYLLVV